MEEVSKSQSKSILSTQGGQFPLRDLKRWSVGLFIWTSLLAASEIATALSASAVGGQTALLVGFVLVGSALLIVGTHRRIQSLEDAVVDLVLPDVDQMTLPFEDGQALLYQEVRRARRYDRALSVVSVRLNPASGELEEQQLLADIQRAVLWRRANAQLAAMLDTETNGCQILTEREDHYVILLPETDRSGAQALMSRLRSQTRAELGVDLDFGVSSFPDENVTFTRLLEAAENEMLESRNNGGSQDLPGYAPEATARG